MSQVTQPSRINGRLAEPTRPAPLFKGRLHLLVVYRQGETADEPSLVAVIGEAPPLLTSLAAAGSLPAVCCCRRS